ncbi:hypothetical protein K9N68_09680 [Kovacikia minuta CCNUW1]|uniref:hypothetical protein n=1 Tax=Kovacikia minuta TaxID=2931930 RepID=UPI001CCA2E73|nr:hypothetical protein [Kovacikia minuta]UBF28123.1 hypothetical protein K9N68_09680 [Kovacikia minuta CCNUW1]
MTRISRPAPNHGQQPQQEIVATSITLQLGSKYYASQFHEGGELSILSVEEVVNNLGQVVEAVWKSDWTEITPGIRTKHEAIEIQHFACPVLLSFIQKRDGLYVDRRYNEERYSAIDRFQIRYEQG